MARTKFDEFVSDLERRRIFEQEALAFEATEVISELMAAAGVSKAELARRLGTSRAFVTQTLSGSRNLTLHTLADIAFVLGCRISISQKNESGGRSSKRPFLVYRDHSQLKPSSPDSDLAPDLQVA